MVLYLKNKSCVFSFSPVILNLVFMKHSFIYNTILYNFTLYNFVFFMDA